MNNEPISDKQIDNLIDAAMSQTPRTDKAKFLANTTTFGQVLVNVDLACTLERELSAAKREIEELRQFKDGVIENAPACGACAEQLFCGSSMHPHETDCPQANSEALKSALKVAAKLLASNDCLCWGKCETQVERDYVCDKCTALANPIIQQALKEE